MNVCFIHDVPVVEHTYCWARIKYLSMNLQIPYRCILIFCLSHVHNYTDSIKYLRYMFSSNNSDDTEMLRQM